MKSEADHPASLFIYFKLANADAPRAQQALSDMQSGLRVAHPGLVARLMVRTDHQANDTPTWMEIYEHPHGLSQAFLVDLETAVAALPVGLIGPRHTESFSELRLPAGNAA